jgi:hypothetical protein
MNYDLRIHPALNVGQTLQKMQMANARRESQRGGASAGTVPGGPAKLTGNHSLIRGNSNTGLLSSSGLSTPEDTRKTVFSGDLYA